MSHKFVLFGFGDCIISIQERTAYSTCFINSNGFLYIFQATYLLSKQETNARVITRNNEYLCQGRLLVFTSVLLSSELAWARDCQRGKCYRGLIDCCSEWCNCYENLLDIWSSLIKTMLLINMFMSIKSSNHHEKLEQDCSISLSMFMMHLCCNQQD